MIDCKVIKLERNNFVIPAYEITCPYCRSKILFEIELVKSCYNLFCNYCKQKLEIEKLTK